MGCSVVACQRHGLPGTERISSHALLILLEVGRDPLTRQKLGKRGRLFYVRGFRRGGGGGKQKWRGKANGVRMIVESLTPKSGIREQNLAKADSCIAAK